MGSQVDPVPGPAREDVLALPVRSRRDRLVAAMATVASSEGIRATSVSKVVAEASVSRNCFYEHFANKEDCFLATYDTAVALAEERMRAAVAPARTRAETVEAGLGALLAAAAAAPALAWLCLVEVLAAGPPALARRDATMRALAATLGDPGDEPSDGAAATPAKVLVGGVYEVVYARVLKGDTASLPSLLPDIMYVWTAPIAGPAGAAAARARAVRARGAGRVLPLSIASQPTHHTTRA